MSADSSREPRARPESPPAARPETTPDRGGADTPDSDRTDPHHPATSTALGWPDVPGYEITGEIARGGMGVVYAARDLALGREVAIKTILPSLAADPRYPAQFDREARLTALLPHPGIPPIHQVGTLPDGRPFLTMKLIKGRTLADELATTDRAANLPRLLGVFELIGQAVGYAHSVGIIHRDLKPANVMVGAFGEVQVMAGGWRK
jgi:serine/threonine protein kinase